MKTTNNVPPKSAVLDATAKNAPHGQAHPDHLKEHQKLPPLAAVLRANGPELQVPANELEFANFYHL